MRRPAAVAHMAMEDLEGFVSVPAVALFIDHDRVHTQGLQGLYLPASRFARPAWATIWLNPDLRGSAMYRVALHELGHALGLDHTRTGIMAPKRRVPADFDQTDPTPAQRKRWCLEIARLVLMNRAKQWKAA